MHPKNKKAVCIYKSLNLLFKEEDKKMRYGWNVLKFKPLLLSQLEELKKSKPK